MAWLEIIDIRSTRSKCRKLEEQLPQWFKTLQQEMKGDIVKIYRHVTLETDFSIHFYHNGIPATHHIHPTSLRLISILKEYGLVSHSFWVEQFK